MIITDCGFFYICEECKPCVYKGPNDDYKPPCEVCEKRTLNCEDCMYFCSSECPISGDEIPF